jgi:hypothetical protein
MLTLPRSIIEETGNTMTDVFVIRNQLGHYWGKSKTWVDGSEARAVMRAKHEDEAINTLFELGSKDFELRGEVLTAELSQRGEPVIEASQIPLLLEPEPEADADAVESANTEAPAEDNAEVTTEKPAPALD